MFVWLILLITSGRINGSVIHYRISINKSARVKNGLRHGSNLGLIDSENGHDREATKKTKLTDQYKVGAKQNNYTTACPDRLLFATSELFHFYILFFHLM